MELPVVHLDLGHPPGVTNQTTSVLELTEVDSGRTKMCELDMKEKYDERLQNVFL